LFSQGDEHLKSKYAHVLVTGGAGFIGSHIVDRLLENGFEVKVIDDLSTGRLDNIKFLIGKSNFRFIKGDIRKRETVKKAVKDVEVVFHAAAFVSVTQSVDNPFIANDVNATGTLNLLEASLSSNVKRFILSSSAAVYGQQDALPIKEEAQPNPDSPYAISKLAAELYTETYYRNYGLETVCLRYFNVYGPRQTNGPYAAVITAFIDHLTRNKPPIIYGDGEQTRDFINAKDVVDANILAMEKNCGGEIFNIATGSQLTMNKLFEILQILIGKRQIRPIYDKPRPFDIRQSCGDISKANRILGFKPKVSLEKGLLEFIKSRKQNV
jgi:nucleoside-diphosphate-sugar epimerase